MAVYAAHLTRARGAAPSVFQLAAERALADEVKPALRRLVEYLVGERAGLRWAERWFDELYLVLDAALQYHYLKHYAASFSESFYGLMRVELGGRAAAEWGAARLPARAERASLALLVLAPYLRARAEAALARRRDPAQAAGKDKWDSLRAACVRVYSALHTAWCCWRLAQLARYAAGAAGAAGAARPSLRLLGLQLVGAPPPAAEPWRWADLLTGDVGFPALGALALGAAQYAAFGVQLLRAWAALAPAAAALPAPAAPQRPAGSPAAAAAAAARCPLCRGAWRAPAALPVSGYVFCYACIARSLDVAPRCPVTRLAARRDQLVRLYLP